MTRMADPLREFVARGVRIEPAAGHLVSIPVGGPVWEGHDAPEFALHLRDGRPTALPFARGEREAEVVLGPTVWGGYAASNFGNFLAEYAPRLLAGATVMPDARFLFLLPSGLSRADLKPWFWEVLAWFGIAQEQVATCGSAPLIIDELHVFPQGEFMGRGGEPEPAYLDLLDRHVQSRGITGGRSETVYVSRAGLGVGSLGGELYLEQMLSRVGVDTVRPEAMPIAEQLAWYARAQTIVFAEGSSVHGRQLLGRVPGREVVLVRRKGQHFGARALRSRCDELRYLDALDVSVHFSFDTRTGDPTPFNAFPLMNGDRLVEGLRSIGVDLAPVWDDRAFRRQLEADLDDWARAICRDASPDMLPEMVRLMEGSLYGSGMHRYVARLAEIARAA